jgi:putative SOS response-associated peptidase YedK
VCGRFNLSSPKEIVERFGFMDWSEKRIEPRFNIAPSQEIITIVQLPLEQPALQTAVWGLRPFWLQAGKPPPVNARAESLHSSAMFREARRCLIPATGFYEWRGGQPLHIRLRGGAAFSFAGIWLPPAHHGGAPTAAIVTTRPNELVAAIHTRMPAILRPEDERRWLDPASDAREIASRPLDATEMEAYAVGRQVNSWENEGPELIKPAAPDAARQPGLPL